MSDYCELPEFYAETFPRARKVHPCCECAAPIRVGEKHLYWRNKWEGQFDSGRQHMVCRELCILMNNEGDGCCAFGAMFEEWQECDWGRQGYKLDPGFREARKLMAAIKLRERLERREKAKPA